MAYLYFIIKTSTIMKTYPKKEKKAFQPRFLSNGVTNPANYFDTKQKNTSEPSESNKRAAVEFRAELKMARQNEHYFNY